LATLSCTRSVRARSLLRPSSSTPDLSQTGQYWGTFNFGTVTKLNKWLGWQNSFGDIYVSNPPVGTKKNDLILSTGLNFSFTH
jgi:hypothetical protein